jgi:hypothetical protein
MSRAMARDRMPQKTPIELEQALDRLLNVLASACDLRSGAAQGEVSRALHESAEVARRLGLQPEDLLRALKPRLERVAARVPAGSREAYLRTITTLAIDAFIGDG